MELPCRAEGFDHLFVVRVLGDGQFEVGDQAGCSRVPEVSCKPYTTVHSPDYHDQRSGFSHESEHRGLNQKLVFGSLTQIG
jgi:hypothetical protein